MDIYVLLFILVIGLMVFFGLKEIADAIRNPQPKNKIARNAMGVKNKAEIIKKQDEVDSILK